MRVVPAAAAVSTAVSVALVLAFAPSGPAIRARAAPVPDGYRVTRVLHGRDGYAVEYRLVTPSGADAVLARTSDPAPRSDPLIQEWTGYSGNGSLMLCATSDRAPRIPPGETYVSSSCGVTVVRRRSVGLMSVAAGPGPPAELRALADASAATRG
jgi:hypothetical protein